MQRLKLALVNQKLVSSRTKAEDYIKLGLVRVNGKKVSDPEYLLAPIDKLSLSQSRSYVSRGGLKLESIANVLKLDFENKIILDVGSSTGGFTDYALQHGAMKVIAIDSGTNQLHPSLRSDQRIDLREQVDIRSINSVEKVDLVLVDVSFISLRSVLPKVITLINPATPILALFKPQFEAAKNELNKGIVKNSNFRRNLIREFETWLVSQKIITISKADSSIEGSKGNSERFYLLKSSIKR